MSLRRQRERGKADDEVHERITDLEKVFESVKKRSDRADDEEWLDEMIEKLEGDEPIVGNWDLTGQND